MTDMKFTKDHEWIKLEGGEVAVLGITEYAQHALGDLVYIELPKVGAKFSKGAHVAVVESVKTAAEVYTPVTGEIVAVNTALESDYDLLKSETDGWIAKIKMTDAAEIDGLMDKAAYDAYCKTQG
jgi:glycine cleavage system H protein